MATLTALVALSIDMVLPALPAIGASLGVVRANDNQLVVTLFFLGFGIGQLFYGPLSDATGRKPAAYVGLAVYLIGVALSLFATTATAMLAGRTLQGLGVAGPRTVTLAVVRDRYQGAAMARVMSLVMAVFILVPVFAPALGQVALSLSGWRAIFGVYLVMAVAAGSWFALRQEETLPAERRLPLSVGRLAGAAREVVKNRVAVGYTVASGIVFGAFLAYLSTAQQILQTQYQLGSRFALYFSALAVAIGAASLVNSRLVGRLGMKRLAHGGLRAIGGVSALFALVAVATQGSPPLWALMTYLMVTFFAVGLLFGNLNALAMEPLGHVAGTASSIVGGASMLVSLVLGTAIAQSYDGTVVPLVAGFAVLGVLASIVAWWAEQGRQVAAA